MKFAYLLAGIALAAASVPAAAHTTSLGYVPGSVNGSVIIWAGHYSHGDLPSVEGIGTLTGVSLTYSSTKPFSIGVVSSKPTGLVDGKNNFFWSAAPYIFPQNVDPNLFGGVVQWQGVEFTGLAAGTYDYTCGNTCGTSAEWDSLSTAGGNGGTVRFTLTNGDINPGVPEPATWGMMLVGFGVVGATMRRRASNVTLAA